MQTDVKSIIETAIAEEKKANRFYLNLASQMKEKGARMKFEIMADLELKHYESLLTYYEGKFGQRPAIKEVEVFTIVRPETPSRTASFEEAIKIIMDTEQRAYEFYKKASERSTDPKDKKIFKTLAKMEQAHFEQFRTEYNYATENVIRFSSEDIPWMMEVG
ncbi:MAG: ferritin family protein [Candidatus Kuenenia sp.]|nr:ferritin family protein [Candidatus Kuenenia hertensis]